MSWEWKLVPDSCTGCGICVDVCPSDALEMTREMPYSEPRPGRCDGCMTCVNECPFDAIEVNETAEAE